MPPKLIVMIWNFPTFIVATSIVLMLIPRLPRLGKVNRGPGLELCQLMLISLFREIMPVGYARDPASVTCRQSYWLLSSPQVGVPTVALDDRQQGRKVDIDR